MIYLDCVKFVEFAVSMIKEIIIMKLLKFLKYFLSFVIKIVYSVFLNLFLVIFTNFKEIFQFFVGFLY